MNPSTLPEQKDRSAFEHSTALPNGNTVLRDVRAKRQSLVSIIFDRHLLMRFFNGVALAAMDLVLLFASLVIALRVKAALTADATSLDGSISYAQEVVPFAALVMLLLFSGDGLYRPRNLRPGSARIMGALFKVTLVTLVFALVEGQQFQSYYIFWSTFIVAAGLIVTARLIYDRTSERLENAFGRERRAVIVGTNHQIEAVADALERAPIVRIKPVGFISLEPRAENGLRDLGSIDSIEDHFDEIDEVIIADPTFPAEQTVMLVDRCHRGGVHLRVAPTTMEILRADEAEFVPGETLPLFEIKPPVFEGAAFVVKRGFDILVSGLLLVMFSPVLLFAALSVKLTSKGPVFFLSPRPGLGGESFNCIKFRTMVTNAESLQAELEEHNEADGAIFKIREDPRLTPPGSFLRRWSIDELPQLINVLKGDMSLVGPRPLPHRDYERLEEWHKKRYLVLPGLTGLWQVSGRSELEFDDLVRLDFLYIERWSVFLDVVIMLRTIPAVVRKHGAY
ncbi:MAG: sugar transferase [Thermoleophilaceae bacterium]|nr:sugar transferase [Thermoleophilaceae bacterium]